MDFLSTYLFYKETNMNVQEIDAQIKQLQLLRKQELNNQRNKDLSLVKSLCSQHGFTVKMLKGSLKTGRNRRTKAEMMAQTGIAI